MHSNVKSWFGLFKNAAMNWSNDHAPQLGAALSFYTIFSLAPLLTIVITIASLWFSDNASGQIFVQIGSVIGADNAQSLQKMLVQDTSQKTSGVFTAISAAVMLILGATGVFTQLQDSLNEIWKVQLRPGQGIMGFIRHRILSFAMVLGIAFLLLVSLLLSTFMAAMGKYFGGFIGNSSEMFELLNTVVSFGLITVLFAMMFKYLPDVEVSWKDVWFGAIFTAALFTVGKLALGLYLGKSSVVSTYKAAGALLIVLLWVYYSAQILFYGAELTQEYAKMKGRSIQPSPHAQLAAGKECQKKDNKTSTDQITEQTVQTTPPGKPKNQPDPVLELGSMRAARIMIDRQIRSRQSKRFWGSLIVLGVISFIPFRTKIALARKVLRLLS